MRSFTCFAASLTVAVFLMTMAFEIGSTEASPLPGIIEPDWIDKGLNFIFGKTNYGVGMDVKMRPDSWLPEMDLTVGRYPDSYRNVFLACVIAIGLIVLALTISCFRCICTPPQTQSYRMVV